MIRRLLSASGTHRSASPAAGLSVVLALLAGCASAPADRPGETAALAPWEASPEDAYEQEEWWEFLEPDGPAVKLVSHGPFEPAADGMPLPPPTDNWLDHEYEERNSSARREWMRSMHRAPPGVDWRALERGNGAAQQSKRNGLAQLAATASRWTELGSDNQAGRMHAVAFSPDGQVMYAGSALGGVWKADLDGNGWTPIGDNLYGGAHHLAVVAGDAPGDPPVVVRGTWGGALDVSRDDGTTWTTPAPFGTSIGVRRIVTALDGSNAVFVVAKVKDGALGTYRWGVFRSTDKAHTFTNVHNLGSSFQGDLWVTRSGPVVLWAVKNGLVEKSVDLGDNWTTAGTIPTGSEARITGSEAGAPTLYVVLDGTLRRSDDGGANWTVLAALSDFWGQVNASITNPSLLAYGGVEVWRSTNAGVSFSKVNGWGDYYGNPAAKLHADIQGLFAFPTAGGGETWYVGTDGGLYRSADGLSSVANLSLNGLRVSQYYTTLTSSANPAHVAAGAQDQGWQWASSAATGSAADFSQLISGDYGHATSGDGTHAYVFSVYPGFVLVHKGETNPKLYTTDFPAGATLGWLPMVVADPTDVTRFFLCADKLWRYKKNFAPLNTWSPVQWSTQDFALSAGEYLTALDFSPGNPQRAYAVTSQGRLWVSDDGGVTWTQTASGAPDEHYFYGNALVASSTSVDTCYVGGSGYGGPAVRRSTDGGISWQAWSNGLPSTLVYSLAEAPDGTLFAGTETAAYRRGPADPAWIDITSNEAPVTIYWSAEYAATDNVVRFGTYGRGIWDYSLDDPCAYAAYGTGLGGKNILTLACASPTKLGTTHVLELAGGTPNASGVLLYSPAEGSFPFKGGTLLVDPTVMLVLPIRVTAGGDVSLPLAVPGDPALVGLPLHFQVALTSAGWAFSNGIQGTLCP